MGLLNQLGAAYGALVLDAALPFLGGIVIGTAIELYLPRGWAERWLARGPSSLALAVLAGALLPGCAMSAVPVARSLRARGAPVGTLAAFLLIAPLISPHTIAMTAVMIGAGFAVVRVVLPVAGTLLFGAIVNRVAQRPATDAAAYPASGAEVATEDASEAGCGSSCGCCGETGGRRSGPVARIGRALWENARSMLPLFAISLAVVAIVSVFVTPATIAQEGQGIWAYLAAVGAGIPLYVCDGGEVVLTRSLLALGLGAGPAFTFMLASVGTCLATIVMGFGIVGRRVTIAYVTGTLALALLSGWFVAAVSAFHPAIEVTQGPTGL